MSEDKNGKVTLPPLRRGSEITLEEFDERMRLIDKLFTELEDTIGFINRRIEQRGVLPRKPRRGESERD